MATILQKQLLFRIKWERNSGNDEKSNCLKLSKSPISSTSCKCCLLSGKVNQNSMSRIATSCNRSWETVNIISELVKEEICCIFFISCALCSGGSRISLRRGRQLPGGTNIWFCQIFPKTAWNWKNLDPGVASLMPPLDPPLLCKDSYDE